MFTISQIKKGINESILLNGFHIRCEVIKYHLKSGYIQVTLYITHYKIITHVMKQRVIQIENES